MPESSGFAPPAPLPRRTRGPQPALDALTRQLIAALRQAGLTQQDIPARMGTTRNAISRLERGLDHRPYFTTIERYAHVVGCCIEVVLRPWP